ncbi:hypothetical protein C8R44DRAFT_798536 [Mycena epipterygia]|nr:hypothetical protein C8R44DRAFT_798536 [Mycena epipterygia]
MIPLRVSFCAPPPSTAATQLLDDDEFDCMFLEPCSQEMTEALDEMERPDFVPSQSMSRSQPAPRRCSSPIFATESFKTPACTAPESCVSVASERKKLLESAIVARVPTSEFSECSIIVARTSDSIDIKEEGSSPAVIASSLPSTPPSINTGSKRKRDDWLTDSDSDDETEYKKPKPPATATHLEEFFSSYPKFEYDPSGPASQQFQQLRNVYKKERTKIDPDELYQGYNRALGLAFSQYYGNDANDLGNWQKLCRTVEIFPVPDSVEECKFAIEDSHVNLIDLMDIQTTGEPVHRFRTERELATYTKKTGKIFPSSRAHKGDLLQALLRRIWHPPPENLMRRGGHWVERDP